MNRIRLTDEQWNLIDGAREKRELDPQYLASMEECKAIDAFLIESARERMNLIEPDIESDMESIDMGFYE